MAASELELLRDQLQRLENRINELETKEAQTAETAEENREVIETEVIKSGGSLGGFIFPGTDTRVTIDGYVKGDFIYDLNGSVGSDDLFVPESIGVGDSDDERFTAHARQSRFILRTSTPSSFGPVKTLFEGDFFGVGGNEVISNSFSFRIRHLYGEVGNFAAGQFWTNFMPIEAYPSTVDFQGPAGIPFIRQAQVRWTQPVTDNFEIRASLENSEFTGIADDDGDPATDPVGFGETTGALGGFEAGIDVAPDAILTGLYSGDFGLVRGSVLGRFFGGNEGIDGVGDDGDGAFGWGVNLATNARLFEGTRLLMSATYGDGIGRYIINGFAADGFIDADGNVDTIRSLGLTAQLQQKLTPDVTAALAGGYYRVFDTFFPTDIEDLQTVHATLFWRPVDRVTFGAEAIWGRANQALDGQDDSAVRLQTSLQINF